MKKYHIICLAAALLIAGCTNPLDSYINKPAAGAPGALTEITAEPGMGLVTFRWKNPNNYYYTDISYTDPDGKTVKKLVSKYSVDETMGDGYSRFVFSGFEISQEFVFTLVPYSAYGETGPASTITCTPEDKQGVYRYILETMTVEPAPFGAYISWENEWEAFVSFTVSFTDQKGQPHVITIEATDKPGREYIGEFTGETELTIIAYNIHGAASEPYVVRVAPKEVSVDTPIVGWFLNNDGSLTETFQSGGDKQSYAVIAYVGKVEHYFNKFLAIALSDTDPEGNETSTSMSWNDGPMAVDNYAAKHPITLDGTTYATNTSGAAYDAVSHGRKSSSATCEAVAAIGWRMPSVTDWRYVFEGLTADESEENRASATNPLGVASGSPNNISANEGVILRSAINKACDNSGIPAGGFYWSSSEWADDAGYCWYYRFDMSIWSLLGKAEPYPRVRAVFAY